MAKRRRKAKRPSSANSSSSASRTAPSSSSSSANDNNNKIVSASASNSNTASSNNNNNDNNDHNNTLILTSVKRNGLFECDYCHTDISQVPRICSSVCVDFDICLECFISQHTNQYNLTHSASRNDNGNSNGNNTKKEQNHQNRHDPFVHGYRVADSTRYFLFPSLRGVDVEIITDANATDDANNADATQDADSNQDANANVTIESQRKNKDDNENVNDKNGEDKKQVNLNKDNNDDENKMDIDESTHTSTAENGADVAVTSTDAIMKNNDFGNVNSKKSINTDTDKKNDINDATDAIAGATDGADGADTKHEQAQKQNDTTNTAKIIKDEGDDKEEKNQNISASATASDDKMDVEMSAATTSNTCAPETKDEKMKETNDATPSTTATSTTKTASAIDENKMKTSDSTNDEKSSSGSNNNNYSNINNNKNIHKEYTVTDDARYMWTAEEDLRLLEAISTFGLGNWADISEEVSSMSSSNKTPKKCMERYIDDFLGQYGHILPEYTLVEIQKDDQNEDKNHDTEVNHDDNANMLDSEKQGGEQQQNNNSRKRARPITTNDATKEPSIAFKHNNKAYCAAKTSSLPGYDQIWPNPYIPPLPNIKMGDDVGRDHAVRSEQAFVKAIASASGSEEVQSIRKEWEKQLNQVGGPRVLPPRAEDVKKIPGAELAGFMPRRGDFDVEWDNDADKLLEDMEFSPSDSQEERDIKIRVIEIYNSKLDEREKRKQFLIDHDLLDYRKKQREDRKLPADERDLVNRMRLFARFHSAEEHQKLIDELLKAKRLRKEIARLQMYHRMGFSSLLDVERFELDRNRRESHRIACRQKEKEEQKEQLAAVKAAGDVVTSGTNFSADDKETYHRQYKNSDRKIRRSINRTQSGNSSTGEKDTNGVVDVKKEDTMDKADTSAAVAPNKAGDTLVMSGKDSLDLEKESATSHTVLTKDSLSISAGTEQKTPGQKFDIRNYEGIELLSSKEIGLCQRLELKPMLYLKAKKGLIQDSLSKGILNNETKNRSVVKIDVKSKGDIVKFVLQSGWIPSAPGSGE